MFTNWLCISPRSDSYHANIAVLALHTVFTASMVRHPLPNGLAAIKMGTHPLEASHPVEVSHLVADNVMVHGKEVRNQFHYCGTKDCPWRYSSELGKYFRVTEFPASYPLPGKRKL